MLTTNDIHEIKLACKQAKNLYRQIKICAEMYEIRKEDVLEIIGLNKMPAYKDVENIELIKWAADLYKRGYQQKQAAELIGVTVHVYTEWKRKHEDLFE